MRVQSNREPNDPRGIILAPSQTAGMTISITNHKRGHVGPDGSVLLRQAVFNYSHTTYRFWNQRRNSRRRGAPTDTFRPKLKKNQGNVLGHGGLLFDPTFRPFSCQRAAGISRRLTTRDPAAFRGQYPTQ